MRSVEKLQRTIDNNRSYATNTVGISLRSFRAPLCSWMETCGLVSLEAALAGAPVVASTFGHELEYLERDAWYADPADGESIRLAVESAIANGRQAIQVHKLNNELERFNWERTAYETETLYKEILNESA